MCPAKDMGIIKVRALRRPLLCAASQLRHAFRKDAAGELLLRHGEGEGSEGGRLGAGRARFVAGGLWVGIGCWKRLSVWLICHDGGSSTASQRVQGYVDELCSVAVVAVRVP